MRLKNRSVLLVETLENRCLPSANVILEWNQLALHAVGQARLSPVFVSRDLAIVQAAVYDSVVAIDRSFDPYHAHVDASREASPEAAAAQAAHDTLATLFPSQTSTFDAALVADLAAIPPGPASQGIEVGHEVARQILDWRSTDGSSDSVAYTPGTDPGDWQPTPPANLPALAPQWPDVTPFALSAGSQFRPAPPPALDSAAYTAAFNEVKDLGNVNSTTRTNEQTQIAKFWNDGLGTAFAMGYWNRIAEQVATDQGLGLVQDARVFALLNIAEADAQIACWDAKYTYNLWRPVTAIRAADTDGNPATDPDATWTPLLVTPNFPSYTSAHSTLSAAAAGVLTDLFGDNYHFTVTADGLPGVTRSFDSFGAAAAEAGRSRIYGGIHYQFDNVNGQAVGGKVADFVVVNYLLANPAKIESVVINDGSAQRSMVNSVTITFDRVVTVDPGAFGLQRNGGSVVSLSVAASVVDGRTVAVLTFTGSGIIGGSLADGNYVLTIRGDHINDELGQSLDGDGDGVVGGNRSDAFFRLYGDSDGDRDVDLLDVGRFLSTLGRGRDNAHFLQYEDFNGDGQVGLIDLLAFIGRVGTHLNP